MLAVGTRQFVNKIVSELQVLVQDEDVTFMYITFKYNSTVDTHAESLLIFTLTLQNVFIAVARRLFIKPATADISSFHFGSYDFHGDRFFRFISSFCLSPSTSANCTLSSEYLPCISFSSLSTATCLLFNSIVSCISSLMSLKLWKTAASSLCCFKNELTRSKENQ